MGGSITFILTFLKKEQLCTPDLRFSDTTIHLSAIDL